MTKLTSLRLLAAVSAVTTTSLTAFAGAGDVLLWKCENQTNQKIHWDVSIQPGLIDGGKFQIDVLKTYESNSKSYTGQINAGPFDDQYLKVSTSTGVTPGKVATGSAASLSDSFVFSDVQPSFHKYRGQNGRPAIELLHCEAQPGL